LSGGSTKSARIVAQEVQSSLPLDTREARYARKIARLAVFINIFKMRPDHPSAFETVRRTLVGTFDSINTHEARIDPAVNDPSNNDYLDITSDWLAAGQKHRALIRQLDQQIELANAFYRGRDWFFLKRQAQKRLLSANSRTLLDSDTYKLTREQRS